MRNKKGSTVLFSLMLAVLFFVIGLALAAPLQEVSQQAMDDQQLNCSNSTISDQNKAICTSIDIIPPVFIGILFGLAGLLLSRFL